MESGFDASLVRLTTGPGGQVIIVPRSEPYDARVALAGTALLMSAFLVGVVQQKLPDRAALRGGFYLISTIWMTGCFALLALAYGESHKPHIEAARANERLSRVTFSGQGSSEPNPHSHLWGKGQRLGGK